MSDWARRAGAEEKDATRRVAPPVTGLRKVRGNLGAAFYNLLVGNVPSHAVRQAFLRLAGMKLGRRSTLLRGIIVTTPNQIAIGDHTIIGYSCFLGGEAGLTIGSNVNISSFTVILGGGHDYNDPTFLAVRRPTVIEDYAWLATRSTILSGVRIGRGAVVSAGSVISQDVPPYWVMAGVPARKVGERDPAACVYELDYRPLFC